MASRNSKEFIAAIKDPYGPSRKGVFKFTRENQKLILEAKELGLSDTHCAATAGVSKNTLVYWLRRGEQQLGEDQQPITDTCEFGKFLIEYRLAIARGVAARHRKIQEIADGGQILEEETTVDPKTGAEKKRVRYAPPQWQGYAWITERGFPEYSNRQIMQHEGQVKQEITFVIPDNWRGNPSTLPAAESSPLHAIEGAIEGAIPARETDVIEGVLTPLPEHGIFE